VSSGRTHERPQGLPRRVASLTLRGVTDAGRHAGRALAPISRRVPGLAAPDLASALGRYSSLAATYDLRTAAGDRYRDQTVARLAPRTGEAILDVGCGTGLNFALLEAGLGASGRLVGIDPCAEMLDLARTRVRRRGWRNVELVQAAAEDFDLPVAADAALLCGVHDVMRSPRALANTLRHVRPGGRIVAAGSKWVPWTRADGLALNFSTWGINRDCVTTFEGFDRPWDRLAALVPDLDVAETYYGGGYIAYGTVPARSG